MSIDAKHLGDKKFSDSIGVTPDVLPEIRNSKYAENSKLGCPPTMSTTTPPYPKKQDSKWYVLRTTYGQEKKAYDYLVAKGCKAYLPIERICKISQGKRKFVEKSLISNIFFAYGTEENLKTFVFDNVNLPFLRFYYRYYKEGTAEVKTPLTVPDSQMNAFRIICESKEKNIIISNRKIPKFQRGEMARVVEGKFKGVEGKVIRYKGQQRVGLVIANMLSVATAYIPEAFLQRL